MIDFLIGAKTWAKKSFRKQTVRCQQVSDCAPWIKFALHHSHHLIFYAFTVHALRPGDIKVVAAVGDSLTVSHLSLVYLLSVL